MYLWYYVLNVITLVIDWMNFILKRMNWITILQVTRDYVKTCSVQLAISHCLTIQLRTVKTEPTFRWSLLLYSVLDVKDYKRYM